VLKNQKETIIFYKLGKRMDYPNAIFNLGVCYEKREGVDKNYQEATHLYFIVSAFHDLKVTVKLLTFLLNGLE
jgi:TPR repeat protein